ncbi:hypothetical protein Tco_1399783 [Tanacetum coccineum]
MSFGVTTLRALVYAGDETSGDARSWYMIIGDAKSWVCFDEGLIMAVYRNAQEYLNHLMCVVFKRVYYFNMVCGEVVCLGVWGGGWGGWLCGGGREVGGSGDGEEWPVAGRNGARGVTCGDWESGGVAEGECGGGERWGRGGERGTDGVGEEMGCQVGGSGWEDEGGALRRSSRRCRGGEFGGGVVGCEGG